jgi:hypothetical protein
MIVVSIFTSHISAINNQGLKWGVEVGDVSYYTFEFHHSELSSARPRDGIEIIYVRVARLPEIVSNISSYEQLWGVRKNVYWANETEILSTSAFYPMTFSICPIGNWSLLTELVLEFPSIIPDEFINTANSWGYNTSYGWEWAEVKTAREVSKFDGVSLHNFEERRIYEHGELYVRTHELTRINETTNTTTTEPYLPFLIGGLTGTIGFVFVVMLWYNRIRR